MLLFLVSSPALAQSIVGGDLVDPGDWPDTVALMQQGQAICTGTLIAPDVVLTAGHCVVQGANPTQVVAGTTNYTVGGETAQIAQKIESDEGWTTRDIAVLVLASDIVTVQPRTIGADCVADAFVDGVDSVVVGYGATDKQGTQYGTQLREATVPVVDADCSSPSYGCVGSINPGGEFVAGGDGVDTCSGDSGGPLYFVYDGEPYLMGVTSRAISQPGPPCGQGGVYVRADDNIAWIESKIGKTLPRPSCDGGDDGGGDDGGGGDDTGGGNPDPQPDTGGVDTGLVLQGDAAERPRGTVTPGPFSAAYGGCACATAGDLSTTVAGWLALLGGLVGLRRRR